MKTLIYSFFLLFPLLLPSQRLPSWAMPDSLRYIQKWAYSTQRHYQYYSVQDKSIVPRLPLFRHFKDLGENRYAYAISYGHRIYGIKNQDGQIIVRPRFEKVDEFRHGLASVQYKGKWGVIDTNGNYVVPPVHRHGFLYKRGLIQVTDTQGKLPVYNRAGDLLFYATSPACPQLTLRANPFLHKDYYSFDCTEEGLVLTGFDGSRRLLQENEQLEDPILCLYLYMMSEGKSPPCIDGLPVPTSINPINPDVYLLHTANGVIYYDISKQQYLDLGWQIATLDQETQQILVGKYGKYEGHTSNRIMGIVDTEARTLLDFSYESILGFTERYYKVQQRGRYGIMDKNSLQVLSPIAFHEIKSTCDPNLFLVKNESKWSLLDIETQEQYFLVAGKDVECQHGLYLVTPETKDKSAFVVNKQGEIILEALEDESAKISIDPAVILVESELLFTLYDHQGKLIGEHIFDRMYFMGKDYYFLGWRTARWYDAERNFIREFDPFIGVSLHNQLGIGKGAKMIYLNLDGKEAKNSALYHEQLGPLLEQEQYVAAADLMQQSYEANPYDGPAYLNAARYRLMDSLESPKQIELAVKEMERYKKLGPDNYELAILHCSILLAKGKLEEALDVLLNKAENESMYYFDEAISLYLPQYLYRKLGKKKALKKLEEELKEHEELFGTNLEYSVSYYKIQHPFITKLLLDEHKNQGKSQ